MNHTNQMFYVLMYASCGKKLEQYKKINEVHRKKTSLVRLLLKHCLNNAGMDKPV